MIKYFYLMKISAQVYSAQRDKIESWMFAT